MYMHSKCEPAASGVASAGEHGCGCAGCRLILWDGAGDADAPVLPLSSVQRFNGRPKPLLVSKEHETEATGLPCRLVHHHARFGRIVLAELCGRWTSQSNFELAET